MQVRIHSSYGCTIRVGYSEATRTGGGFFHGGVSVDAMPDCGPGSWIDFVAEDWRLLDAGKRRLLFDHTCGTVPLCTEPPSTPALPHSPHSPHTPPPTPPTPPPCAKPSFEHAHAPTPPKTHPKPTLHRIYKLLMAGFRPGPSTCPQPRRASACRRPRPSSLEARPLHCLRWQVQRCSPSAVFSFIL